MFASVAEVSAVYPIKNRIREQEATRDSTVIFLPPEFVNDSSCPGHCASQSLHCSNFLLAA
jgi:hypothetical protein